MATANLDHEDGQQADCDCCGRKRQLSRVWFCGMETWACAECRHEEPALNCGGEDD